MDELSFVERGDLKDGDMNALKENDSDDEYIRSYSSERTLMDDEEEKDSDEVIVRSKRDNRFLLRLGFLASIGGMLFGYDTGVISGAMIQLRSDASRWEKVGGLNLTSLEQEAVVGGATGGAILGSILSSILNRRFGRRKTVMISSIVFIIGAVWMGIAQSFVSLLLGRVTVGLSVGFASTTVPMYLAEVAPDGKRGLLVTLNSVSIVLGQVLASLVDCGFGQGRVEEGWRYMLGLGGAPALLLLYGFAAYLPESPRWLLAHRRATEAESALQLIRSQTKDEGTKRFDSFLESRPRKIVCTFLFRQQSLTTIVRFLATRQFNQSFNASNLSSRKINPMRDRSRHPICGIVVDSYRSDADFNFSNSLQG